MTRIFVILADSTQLVQGQGWGEARAVLALVLLILFALVLLVRPEPYVVLVILARRVNGFGGRWFYVIFSGDAGDQAGASPKELQGSAPSHRKPRRQA